MLGIAVTLASALDCAQLEYRERFPHREVILCKKQGLFLIKTCETWPGDTNSPQGRNASRARLTAYALIRILNTVLADPNVRFCSDPPKPRR